MRLTTYRRNDIAEAFVGRVYAYVPVIAKQGRFGLGIAEANVRGYTPVPLGYYAADSFDEAAQEADRLNFECLNLPSELAWKIQASTMRQGMVDDNKLRKKPKRDATAPYAAA